MKSYKGKHYQMSLKIVTLFENHIGEENGIPRDEIFRKIRGVKYNTDSKKHLSNWLSILRAFSTLRKTSLCFIQSGNFDGIHQPKYFVSKRFAETSDYAKRMAKGTSTRVNTIKNAQESVKAKDFRKEWFE